MVGALSRAVCGNAAHIANVVRQLAGQRVDIVALTGYANSGVECFCMTPARFTFTPVVAIDEEDAMKCTCHREAGSHELCCGREEGRDPDCPQHGDGC